jgi:hypothetical protein
MGRVKLVQVQPSGLIIETPSGYFYDVTRRVEVESLRISQLGIEATTHEGDHVLDIHHISHPGKAYDDDDLVCIGFTSHYEAMRARFGEHLVDGSAGENIIIEYEEEVWPADLGQRIGIENQDSGHMTILDLTSHASPCREFSLFATQSQHVQLPPVKLRETLQFLENGRRGFLLVLGDGQDAAEVRRGDRVFVVGAG